MGIILLSHDTNGIDSKNVWEIQENAKNLHNHDHHSNENNWDSIFDAVNELCTMIMDDYHDKENIKKYLHKIMVNMKVSTPDRDNHHHMNVDNEEFEEIDIFENSGDIKYIECIEM